MVAAIPPLTLVPGPRDQALRKATKKAKQEPVYGDSLTKELLEEAQLLSRSPATVLILGESGAGKEVFANYIHSCSPRSEAPFVAISAAAIPENLLEAELFGYERGAFSGADRAKPGRIEKADGGTFLLDEIGELPLALQAKLLRVLQERQIDRIGSLQSRPIDVRIIATTHRDLSEMVAEGTFRADLYYRLNVLRMNIPSLQQRKGDIAPLSQYFLNKATQAMGLNNLVLSQCSIEKLEQHTWPGNVRELIAVMERAAALVPGPKVVASDLRIDSAPSAKEQESSLNGTLADMEKRLIVETLESVGGKREEAARKLGITSRTLRNKLKAWGL